MGNKRGNIIQVGDVVTLKSGGPKMVVSELQGYDKNTVNVGEQDKVGHVRTTWHDEGGRMQTAVFPLSGIDGSDDYAGVRNVGGRDTSDGQTSDHRAGAQAAKAGHDLPEDANDEYRAGYNRGDKYPRKTPMENRPDAPIDPARDATRYPDRTNPGQIAPDALVAGERRTADRQSEGASGAIGTRT